MIIGAGNVATHISRHFRSQGHRISCVYSRSSSSAGMLAGELKTLGTSDPALVPEKADFYILCVPDRAVVEVAMQFRGYKGIWLHTAGALSLKVLDGIAAEYGVLYPIQSLSRDRKLRLGHIPMLVEGSTGEVLQKIRDLACSITAYVEEADSTVRLKVHLAAVFANNFSNHLVHIAQQILKDAGLDPELLQPLLEETFQKLKELDALDAQTGPAVRGDRESINKHRELLKEHPEWDKLYTFISRDIEGSHK